MDVTQNFFKTQHQIGRIKILNIYIILILFRKNGCTEEEDEFFRVRHRVHLHGGFTTLSCCLDVHQGAEHTRGWFPSHWHVQKSGTHSILVRQGKYCLIYYVYTFEGKKRVDNHIGGIWILFCFSRHMQIVAKSYGMSTRAREQSITFSDMFVHFLSYLKN